MRYLWLIFCTTSVLTLTALSGCSEAPNEQPTMSSDPMTRVNEYFVYEQSLAFLQHYRSQTEALYNSSIGECSVEETSIAAKRALLAKLIGLSASNADLQDIEHLNQLANKQINDCLKINEIATELSEHADIAEQQWREVAGPQMVASGTTDLVAQAMIDGSKRIVTTFSSLQSIGVDETLATQARMASTQGLLDYLNTETPDSLGAWMQGEQEPLRKTIQQSVTSALEAYSTGNVPLGDDALMQIQPSLEALMAHSSDKETTS